MRTHIDDIQKLHALFDINFMEAYQQANPRKRRRIMPYMQSIYRRWYYSALIEETPLTPANLLEAICVHYGHTGAIYPVAHIRNKTKLTGIDIQLLEYSLDNHPIVADMQLLMDYCTPHIDLHESHMFSTVQAMEVGGLVSLNDPLYAAFLLEIALEMKLIAKVPSVGVTRFKPNPDIDAIMAASPKDIFRGIVTAAITIASKGLQNLVMLPDSLFTQSYIRNLLMTPTTTDDIFAKVYELLGYDMDEVMNLTMNEDGDDIGDLDLDLLAGTFMTGVLLDKFFFTPFGHFMKLIRPLYILPFEFRNEVTDYVDTCDDPEEGAIAFFAPCSSYTLTDLGLEYLGLEKTDDNYFDAAASTPFGQMKDTIFSSKEALAVFAEIARHLTPMPYDPLPEDIYTFRVRLASDTAIWAHVQMPSDSTLDDMYVEIVDCLGLKDNSDYIFYHDKTENPFAEYTSQRRAKRGRKTSDTTLEELDFQHQKQMLLVAYNQALPFGDEAPTLHLQLEMMHIKPPEVGYDYPRVSRISKGLKDSWDL